MTKIATRDSYGKAITQIVKEDKRVIVLDADLSGSTKSGCAKDADPKRHLNMGIAESNMMSVAAGLAANGNTVFASSFAMFATGRAYEQIRNSIAYPKLNVKICASHAGLTVGEDGASHQTIEDISLMRGIPNMVVVQPVDDIEAMAAIKAVYKHDGPCYVRLGRAGVETINTDDYEFELGKGKILREGKDIAILATGMMVMEALKAYDILLEEGFNPTIVNIHTIKPIDKDLIINLSKTHNLFITCEEHSIIGGLGSAVSEVLSVNCPSKQIMIGIKDVFGESGTPLDLCEKYGLTYKQIVDAVKNN